MPLKINVSLAVAGLTFAIEASSVDEMTDAIQQLHSVLDQKTGVGQTGTPAPAPTPTETKPGKKSASTEKAAASSPPADSTKADSAASAATPASAPPPAAEVTYEKSGIPEKIAGYLGAKESGGYAERRAAMVALLTEFKVKTGKDLTAAQFGDFDAALTKLSTSAEEDLG